MNKLTVILNGPPCSGKNYITNQLIEHLAISGISTEHLMFKTGLYKETAQQYFMPEEDFIRIASNRATKEIPNERLDGLTPREALIDVSEHYIKPLLGRDYFAQLLLEDVTNHDIYVISDGGFKEEVQALIDSPKIGRILLIHLYSEINISSPQDTFKNDSRSFITRNMLEDPENKLVVNSVFNSKENNLAIIEILHLIFTTLYK